MGPHYKICKKPLEFKEKLDNDKKTRSTFINNKKRFRTLILIYSKLL